MTFNKKTPLSKLRSKIVRKGMFTQLPYKVKAVEPEERLFRTVIDYALYDLTSPKEEERIEVIKWLHPQGTDFKEVCLLAGLSSLRVYNMCLFFLHNFFSSYLQELYCHQELNGGIVKFSPELTSVDFSSNK